MLSFSGGKAIWTGTQGARYTYGSAWDGQPVNQSSAVSLPFSFNFNGTAYTNITVYMSGMITLGSGTVKASYDNNLAGAGLPTIAPFWDDLHLTGYAGGCFSPSVSYGTSGSAPNRIFVIQWKDMEINYGNYYGSKYGWCNRGTFQLHLYESGKIAFVYGKMQWKPDCSWWVGYENYGMTNGVSGSIGLSSGTGQFISVTPTGSTATASMVSSFDAIDLDKYSINNGVSYEFIGPNIQMSTSPKQLFFGTVSSGSTVDMNFSITHVGQDKTLNVSSITLSGVNASQWSIVSPLPSPLLPGQTANITVRYAPNANGPHTAFVTIASNGRDSGAQQITLNGICVAPEIEIIALGPVNTPTKMFRKTKVVVADSLKERFLVKNTGAGALILSNTSVITGDDAVMFKITRLPTVGIMPDNVDTVEVGFYPRREGGVQAKLEVRSNAANGSKFIDFAPIGIIPRLEIVQGEFMTIDSIPIGTRVCKNIDLYNPGSAPLTLTKNYLSSADGDFEYTPLTGSDTIIAPLSTKTVQICITGLQKGTRRARLRFTTNIPLTYPEFGPRQDTSSKVIELWAGVVPVDLSKVAIKPFGPENIVDEPVTTTIDITNAGSELAEYQAPIFSGSGKDVFTVTSGTFPMQIAPGKTASFTVQALPKTRGLHTADMTINWKSDDREHVINGEIAVEAVIACSQASADQDFGKLLLGEETIKQIEISNCGDIAQTYTASLTGEGFRLVSEPVSTEIASGEKAIYTVAFSPSKEGNFAGGLRISGKHVADMNVALTGLGEKPVVASVSNSSEQSGYVLYQNIPNPSTNMTTIRFTLPKSTYVKVGLTDVTGKFVKEVASGMYTEGTNFISMTTNDLASGTYIYTLEADGVRLSRQISVTK